MLSINDLSYYIGGRPIYENANLHIKPKDKIGLIGLNGTGKSTLLKIIVGDLKPDGGEIQKSNDCSIGFLNQDLLSYQSENSILEVAMEAFEEALHVKNQIDKVLKEMELDYQDAQIEKLAKLQERFEALDGYTMEAKAGEILEGIGFTTEELSRPLKTFSGGWRMRVMLAKLLLEKPSLLLLDEPTNHLDLPSIQWVENYLRNYEGSVVVVSHDRRFLDATINKTVEVTNSQLVYYPGNYSFYLEEKDQRNEIQRNAYENQQQKIKQTEKFIERFRAKATKARQVQSKAKMLDKMDKVDDVVETTAAVNFKFKFNQQPGRHIMQLENVSKAYGDLKILQNTHAIIERGDKIALIGANGKGKSTLLRIIAGTEQVEGKRQEGYNVIRAFFAQHQLESLDLENEIIQELVQAGTDKSEMELRGVLGCFLFSGDEAFKKIKVLSGGEKSRVALAKTLISEANFLLLDEPTNHLDMLSVNILVQALDQYLGSYVIVSHDRHFVSQVANKIWYIEDLEIKEYPGTYDEFELWYSEREKRLAKEKTADNNIAAAKKKAEPAKQEKKVNNNNGETRALQNELKSLEENIAQMEKKKKQLEAELAKPEIFGNFEKLAEVNSEFEELQQKLSKSNKEWEALFLKLEEA
ncbi:ABC-F family ATP-binding cassette domain-containing protein [Fulvivirgaceae bacterium LMO-SS25]